MERAARRLIETGALRETDDPRFVRLPLLGLEGHWREVERLTALPDTSYLARLLHFQTFILGLLARAQGDTSRAWEQVRAMWPDGPVTEPTDRYVVFAMPVLLLAAALALDAGDLAAARSWLDAHHHWLA